VQNNAMASRRQDVLPEPSNPYKASPVKRTVLGFVLGRRRTNLNKRGVILEERSIQAALRLFMDSYREQRCFAAQHLDEPLARTAHNGRHRMRLLELRGT